MWCDLLFSYFFFFDVMQKNLNHMTLNFISTALRDNQFFNNLKFQEKVPVTQQTK